MEHLSIPRQKTNILQNFTAYKKIDLKQVINLNVKQENRK